MGQPQQPIRLSAHRGQDNHDAMTILVSLLHAVGHARQPAEQHQRLLHAVVHVGPGLRIEHARERMDLVIDAARVRKTVAVHRAEQR